MKKLLLSFFALAVLFVPNLAQAGTENNLIGVQGYDLVSYHTMGKPVRGNGHNVAVHDGVSYQFSSAENRKTFEANPAKYLPAYGGYCAFGAAVGKKFNGDPNVWKVVDGTLYLNLDKDIQKKWNEDISGNISKADANWVKIKDVPASKL